MVLLLNRCIGADGRWLGRPSWPVRYVGVSDISMHTGRGGRGVDIPHEGCSRTSGMVSTSPVGVVCPLCLPPVRRLGRHEERYHFPAM